MTKVLFALSLPFLFFSSPAFAYRSIHECIGTTTLGYAPVNEPGFAYRMRALRSQCHAAKYHYEAAGVVWNQYYRAYECRVGWFCNSLN